MKPPATSEPRIEFILKNSLAIERKSPFESKDKMIQHIKDVIDSMYAVELRDNVNEFLAISDRQAIITINGANKDRAKVLIDNVTILLKVCPHFGQDTSLTNV